MCYNPVPITDKDSVQLYRDLDEQLTLKQRRDGGYSLLSISYHAKLIFETEEQKEGPYL